MWGLLLSLVGRFGSLLAGPISQFITGINFGQLLSTLAGFGATVLTSVKKYWKIYLLVFLVGLNFFTAYEWHKDHTALKTEKASHQADISSYKKAQADAQAKVTAEKEQLKVQSKEKADEADKNYSSLLDKYRANLLRYETHQGFSGKSSGSELSESTESGDGPGENSDVPATVTITGSDAQICAENTARLQSVHDWAIHLGDKPNE